MQPSFSVYERSQLSWKESRENTLFINHNVTSTVRGHFLVPKSIFGSAVPYQSKVCKSLHIHFELWNYLHLKEKKHE